MLIRSYEKLIKYHTKILIFTDVTKKKIDNCKNINSVNPLYLGITQANGYV